MHREATTSSQLTSGPSQQRSLNYTDLSSLQLPNLPTRTTKSNTGSRGCKLRYLCLFRHGKACSRVDRAILFSLRASSKSSERQPSKHGLYAITMYLSCPSLVSVAHANVGVQEAEHLPNFSRFSFASFPPTSLESHLPFLDPTSPLLHILRSMLTCSSSKRMSSSKAERLLESSNSNHRQLSPEATSRYLEQLMPGPTC